MMQDVIFSTFWRKNKEKYNIFRKIGELSEQQT